MVSSQVAEEGFTLRAPHLARVALVVQADEAANPGTVTLFGTDRIVLQADGFSNLIKKVLRMPTFHTYRPAGD